MDVLLFSSYIKFFFILGKNISILALLNNPKGVLLNLESEIVNIKRGKYIKKTLLSLETGATLFFFCYLKK